MAGYSRKHKGKRIVMTTEQVIASARNDYAGIMQALKVYRESGIPCDMKTIVDTCNDIATVYGQSFATDANATPKTLQAVLDAIQSEVNATVVAVKKKKAADRNVSMAKAQVKAMDFSGLTATEEDPS